MTTKKNSKKAQAEELDINSELAEIGQIITSAAFLMAVRQEVTRVRQGHVVVTDGRRVGVSDYEVVVKCEKGSTKVARRLQDKMPGVEIGEVAKGVLGVRRSRRGRSLRWQT